MTQTGSLALEPYYCLLPEKLRHRIVLDYPLDVLLDRDCELTAYEHGLYQELRALHGAILEVVRGGASATEAAFQHKKKLEEKCKEAAAGNAVTGPFPTAAPIGPSKVQQGPRRPRDTVDLGRTRAPTADPVELYRHALECLLFEKQSERPKTTAFGALRFPVVGASEPDTHSSVSAPTGNILIRGRPGTCKSTLALQLATMCTVPPNYYLSLFLCLEESPDRVRAKCAEMNWQDHFVELKNLTRLDAASSSDEIAQALDEILRPQCKSESKSEGAPPDRIPAPKVLMPILSPRSLHAARAGATETFQTRYEQLERLLRGFRRLSTLKVPKERFPLPQLRMVCIDSLSALAERPLTREELFRVFDLFTNYGVIGVVTAEDQAEENADAMDYLADVVIDLRADEDAGYSTRYIEIKKARHQHQVYGLHPFGIRSYRETHGTTDRSPEIGTAFQAVMVYPSVHHTVASTRQNLLDTPGRQKDELFDVGIPNLRLVLSNRLPRGSIVAINGPRGTFKSHIAHNFLLSGVVNGESVLLVRLGEQEQFSPDRWAPRSSSVRDAWLVSKDVARRLANNCRISGRPEEGTLTSRELLWSFFSPARDKLAGLGVEYKNTAKFVRRVWNFDPSAAVQDRIGSTVPVLIELDLKPGALLPEQFIKLVRDIFRQLDTHEGRPKAAEIRRIVLDDVSLIGTSYPFLRQSKTAGDLFLSAFAHVCRAYNIDLVTLGTSGEFSEADGVVKRAATLADSVLTCNHCDVFGARYVAVTGEGLMVGRKRDPKNRKRREYSEYVPGVVALDDDGLFDVNLERLEGLVGFEQGRVHRPGLVVSVFSEGSILGRYNAEIRTMLGRAFASPGTGQVGADSESARIPDSDISVMEFDSAKSGPLHHSLEVLRGKPIDKTVVCALDEFFLASDTKDAAKPTDLLCDLRSGITELSRFRKELWHEGRLPPKVVAVPYYSNVLLLAYRSDVLGHVLPEGTQEGSDTTWTALARALDAARCWPTLWEFDCGAWSRETLACIVLDLLLSSTNSANGTPVATILAEACSGKKLGELSDEFASLQRLFARSIRIDHGVFPAGPEAGPCPPSAKSGKTASVPVAHRLPSGRMLPQNEFEKEIETYSDKLVGNAAVYLCWYSQLRELIDEHPDLGPNLRVTALPGRGIRGDWYLGVVKGSVSVKLGLNIINILADENEDNRRFNRGVGLPVFRNGPADDGADAAIKQEVSRMAWYRGQVPLSTVLEIHKHARSRSHFPHYQDIRETLAAVGEQIAFPVKGGESIAALLTRASKVVTSAGPDDPPPHARRAARRPSRRVRKGK